MAGGRDNILFYRFLQVVVVCIPVVAIVIAMAISRSVRQVELARIEVANQAVRQAVEKADKWIQDGSLADADQIEEGLNTAKANAVATQKTLVGPTLMAFRNTKSDREATAILDSALKAITEKQFDKSRAFLRQYLQHPSATERQKAPALLSEIALATSDEDALRTLVSMDDRSFGSFSKGDVSSVVLSHPILIETRVATLKKNLAEASRQREEKRKQAEAERLAVEAERLAEQKRIDAEKEAIRHREQLAEKARQEEKEAAERREELESQAKQEEEGRKKRLANSCPLRIIDISLRRDEIGTPQFSLKVTNSGSQTIDAFVVDVACFDKFNNPVKEFGIGSNVGRVTYQEQIGAGSARTTDHYLLYGRNNTRVFKVTVMRVKMGDGTEWSPPEGFEDVNSRTIEAN